MSKTIDNPGGDSPSEQEGVPISELIQQIGEDTVTKRMMSMEIARLTAENIELKAKLENKEKK